MLFQVIFRISKWYYTLCFFLMSLTLQYILVAKFLPEFLIYSSGIKNPDQLLWYSYDYLFHLYSVLGISGRSLYLKMLTLDYVYLLVTTLALVGLIYNLTLKSKWNRLCLLPIIAAFFDLTENICQIILLKGFPVGNRIIVLISSSSSMMKMMLMMVCLLVIVIFLIRFFYLKIRAGAYNNVNGMR